jgi:predicted dehydrogenase
MILQKSCHDMDMLYWLVGAECTKLASFGSLLQFRKENAPEGAPERCLDGCPAEKKCPYNAYRQYLSNDAYWIKNMISLDHSFDARMQALKEGPYGRCVYKCDNDVVDHQVVSMEFANGATAVFTMHGFAVNFGRTLRLVGTKGEIRGHSEKNEIEITDFLTESTDVINLKESFYGHGGGDAGVIEDFIRLVQKDGKVEGLTSAKASVHSHIMAFAAEQSRLDNCVVDLREYVDNISRNRVRS